MPEVSLNTELLFVKVAYLRYDVPLRDVSDNVYEYCTYQAKPDQSHLCLLTQ
jgi:hypothetical protein